MSNRLRWLIGFSRKESKRWCFQVLCTALFLYSGSAGRGQGMVNFFNTPSTLISGMNGAPITGAVGAYYFALLVAPVGTTNLSSFKFTGCYATNASVAGRVIGGWGTVVAGWPPEVEQAFIVCGWEASAGHDWNPAWLVPSSRPTPFGMSAIATGVAGGASGFSDGFPGPPLDLFGLPAISSGFEISTACTGAYWNGFAITPTNQTVDIGASAVFNVLATACPPPLYQWFLNGTPIPGATAYSYQITNAQPAEAGTYLAMLSNSNWPVCCQTQSISATLTILSTPVIDAQPQSQNARVGSNVHLQVIAQGIAPLTYQWFFNNVDLAAAIQPDLWLTNVQVSGSGAYTVVISDPYGAVTSSPAILSIGAGPTVTPPLSATAEIGSPAFFSTLVGGEPPLSIQWFFNGSTPIAGATNSALQLRHVQPAQAGAYAITVTNVFGAVTSSPAQLSLIAPMQRRLVPMIRVTGQAGNSVRIDFLNELQPASHWRALAAFVITNRSEFFFDLAEPLPARRFYRVLRGGSVGPPLVPQVALVPALTLTGAPGSSVRIDYINQYGPAGVWVPLGSVILTNSSQIYFDTSAIGQPPRLWRAIAVP